jgi:hypothetical protein
VGAALLVSNEDVAQLWIFRHDVVHGEDRAARIAKNRIDTLAYEGFHDDLRTTQPHGQPPRRTLITSG